MGKTIYSDNTDINDVNYATVGENIRNGAKNLKLEDLAPFFTNRERVLTGLNANSENLKAFILTLFGSLTADGSWGDNFAIPFSTEELQVIKKSLGIN